MSAHTMMKVRRLASRLAPIALLGLVACDGRDSAHAQDGAGVPLYDNLGSYTHEISTGEPLAQQYFDQGLRLYYAFNHAESARSFAEAARLDEQCAICHWGVALAHGPNINLPMDSAAGAAAWEALQQAVARQAHAAPKERALIEALAQRYTAVPQADRAALDSAYARAMQQVAQQYPGDADVQALYAESLMDLSPWQYWNRDGSPRPDTPRLLAALEAVLGRDPDHPGANHFYIHAVEAVDPARAVPMAERLAGLMPGHIYIRVGRYVDAIRANEHAVHADETFIRDHNPAMGIYTIGYYPHNYDFLSFAASMIGRSTQSLEAAEKMASLVPQDLLGAPGLTVLQNHLTRHFQMRVRFSRWNDIMNAPQPAENLPFARAIAHYARGRARAATGDAAGADAELARLRDAAAHADLQDAAVEFNAATDVLRIAEGVLAGHVAAARGEYDRAVALLREAALAEDELVYGEPPEWSVPVRQELGLVLLQAGRAADAEAAFREDLQRFPDNGWSLDGLARSLTAQGRAAEAAEVRRRFEQIWSSADAPAAPEHH